MKKIIIISISVGFGMISALIICTIALLATGKLKQNVFGGMYWDMGQSDSTIDDYDRKRMVLKELKFNKIDIVKDGQKHKGLLSVTNNSKENCNDHAQFSMVFYKNDKVIGIVDAFESIDIKAGATEKVVMDINKEIPSDFDKIDVLPK